MNDRLIKVHEVERLGIPRTDNYEAWWVKYALYHRGVPMYHGERMVVAQDELALYVAFPKQMKDRHNTNNVRWDLDQGEKDE
jgi:hypothetical protein